jgi:predicted nucleic acid-binding protein
LGVIKPTITDTGILVALIDDDDYWHEWAKRKAATLQPPFLTCETVIAEACYLLRHVHQGEQQVLAMVADAFVQIDFSLSMEAREVKALMKKYENVPMSLADACLVRMSELRGTAEVFTLDSDFRIYRKNGREPIPLIIPDHS